MSAAVQPAPARARRRILGSALIAPVLLPGLGMLASPAHAVQSGGSASMLAAASEPLDHAYDGYLERGASAIRVASARLVYQPRGDRYTLALQVDSMLGQLLFESVGAIDADGLRPLRYRERRDLATRGVREQGVRFAPDHERDPAAKAPPDTVWLPPGGQDRVSLLMQLSLRARTDAPRFTTGLDITLALASLNAVDEARLRVGESQTFERPQGALRALPIRRWASGPDTRIIELWLADDPSRTPVVIRFDDDARALRFVSSR